MSTRSAFRCGATVFTLLLALAGGPAPVSGSQPETPAETQVIEIEMGLADEDFWGMPTDKLDAFLDAVDDAGQYGLRIAAPAQVALDQHQALPVVAVRVATLEDAYNLAFESAAVITAVDLVENRAYAGMAIEQKFATEEPAGSVEPPGPGDSSETYFIDLQDRLDLPWQAGRWLVTLLMRDQSSNRVTTQLGASGATYQDPEVERFLAQQRAALEMPEPWPRPGANTSYLPLADSPELPETSGIVLSLPRVQVIDPEQGLPLKGAFRLPVDNARLAPNTADPLVLEEETVGAVVPINLVLTGSASAIPFVWRLLVPVYQPAATLTERGETSGWFSLDLQELGNVLERSQTWFVYAFSGEVMSGPFLSGLVSREMLPR